MLSEDVLSILRDEGWRQCAVGQRTTQFCGQMSQAQAAIAELVVALSELCTRIDIDGASPLDSSEYGYALAAITKHQQPTTADQKPALYLCTECGGANYGCRCDSLKHCTVPLYTIDKE